MADLRVEMDPRSEDVIEVFADEGMMEYLTMIARADGSSFTTLTSASVMVSIALVENARSYWVGRQTIASQAVVSLTPEQRSSGRNRPGGSVAGAL